MISRVLETGPYPDSACPKMQSLNSFQALCLFTYLSFSRLLEYKKMKAFPLSHPIK